MEKKLYIGNLSFKVGNDELTELFGQAGKVESVKVVTDSATGRSRGFAFVEMQSPEDAQAAIDQLNGKEFEGRNLTVSEARSKGPGTGGGGGGFRGRD